MAICTSYFDRLLWIVTITHPSVETCTSKLYVDWMIIYHPDISFLYVVCECVYVRHEKVLQRLIQTLLCIFFSLSLFCCWYLVLSVILTSSLPVVYENQSFEWLTWFFSPFFPNQFGNTWNSDYCEWFIRIFPFDGHFSVAWFNYPIPTNLCCLHMYDVCVTVVHVSVKYRKHDMNIVNKGNFRYLSTTRTFGNDYYAIDGWWAFFSICLPLEHCKFAVILTRMRNCVHKSLQYCIWLVSWNIAMLISNNSIGFAL